MDDRRGLVLPAPPGANSFAGISYRRVTGAFRFHPRTPTLPAQRPPLPRSEDRPTLTVIETPNVDVGVLDDLGRLSQDPTFVERLLNGFRSDVQRLVKSISDALATRRYEDVKDAAHALKGGAGSVGATQLVQLAIRFEKAGHDVLRMKAASWTEELVRAADAAFAVLDKHLEEQQRRSKN